MEEGQNWGPISAFIVPKFKELWIYSSCGNQLYVRSHTSSYEYFYSPDPAPAAGGGGGGGEVQAPPPAHPGGGEGGGGEEGGAEGDMEDGLSNEQELSTSAVI